MGDVLIHAFNQVEDPVDLEVRPCEQRSLGDLSLNFQVLCASHAISSAAHRGLPGLSKLGVSPVASWLDTIFRSSHEGAYVYKLCSRGPQARYRGIGDCPVVNLTYVSAIHSNASDAKVPICRLQMICIGP